MVYFPEPVFVMIKDFLWGLPTKAHPVANIIHSAFTDQMIYFCSTIWEDSVWVGRQDDRFANKGLFPFSTIIDAGENNGKPGRNMFNSPPLCKYEDETYLHKMLLYSRMIKARRANGADIGPCLIKVIMELKNTRRQLLMATLLPKIPARCMRSKAICVPHRATNAELKSYLKGNGFVLKNKKMKKKALIKLALSF